LRSTITSRPAQIPPCHLPRDHRRLLIERRGPYFFSVPSEKSTGGDEGDQNSTFEVVEVESPRRNLATPDDRASKSGAHWALTSPDPVHPHVFRVLPRTGDHEDQGVWAQQPRASRFLATFGSSDKLTLPDAPTERRVPVVVPAGALSPVVREGRTLTLQRKTVQVEDVFVSASVRGRDGGSHRQSSSATTDPSPRSTVSSRQIRRRHSKSGESRPTAGRHAGTNHDQLRILLFCVGGCVTRFILKPGNPNASNAIQQVFPLRHRPSWWRIEPHRNGLRRNTPLHAFPHRRGSPDPDAAARSRS